MVNSMRKKGWIKIVEAFVAILLVAGVLLVVVNRGYLGGEDISSRVYNFQISFLREVEKNSELREYILELPEDNLPIGWGSFKSENLENIKELLEKRIPNYLNCELKVCKPELVCAFEGGLDKNIYAQAVIIAANQDIYSPKQLKMFCWTN